MGLPTKQSYFDKFLLAITENVDVRNAYFERFGVIHNQDTSPEKIGYQLIDKLSNYGGYETRRKLIESRPITPSDRVLDIGPEMGMESFLLAEVYQKVIVAEPDAATAEVLKRIAEHYYTEDGRKASNVLDIQRIGIIPPDSTWSRTNHTKPINLVSFDARGAADIGDSFGSHFADRILCHHIGFFTPARPQLKVLLTALSSYCSERGVITYCEEAGELEGMVEEYAEYQNYKIPRHKYYKYRSLHHWLRFHPSRIKSYMAELMPGFAITLKIFSEDHLLAIAKRC